MNLNDFKEIKINDLTVIQLNIGDNIIWKKEDPQPTEIPNDEIWYTTTDGLTAQTTDLTGVTSLETMGLVSNTYVDGKGIMKFSKDVKTINNRALYGCSTINSVKLPNSVTTIGSWGFRDCTSITDFTIPSGVTKLGDSAFRGCTSLTSVTIPNSVTSIGKTLFYSVPTQGTLYCDEDWYIGLDETSITNLGNVYYWNRKPIPQPTSTYDYQVATTLSELSTDDNIKYAFTYDNSKWYALNTDKQYEQWGIIEETDDIKSISKYDGKLAILNGDTKYEYQYSNNQWNNVGEVTGGFGLIGQIDRDNPPSTFPTDFYVKQSDVDSSMGMFDLRVTSPNWEWQLSVTLWGGTDGDYRIRGNDWYNGTIETVNIGGIDYIHFSCPDFPNDSIDVERIDWWNEPMNYYGNSTVIPIQYDKTIFNDYSLYQGYPYNSLDDIEHIGKGVIYNIDGYLYKDKERTTINPYNLDDTYGKYKTLSGTSITEIKLLDENIDAIGNNVFQECANLTSIEIPNSVTSIGGSALSYCSSITSITIPNSVTSIGDSAFNGCSSITSITIPNSVTSIGGSALSYCTSLTSITIPNSVTSIGGSALSYCTSLTSITIPNSVTSIGYDAFSNCTSLTSITIPNSVTSIGNYAFYKCTSLTNIELPSSLTSINNNIFYNCTSLTSVGNEGSGASVEIPNTVTSIGSGAFTQCTSLTSVTIPNSVRTINGWAFDACSKLTSIEIPNSVTSIGTYAFSRLPTSGTLYCDEDWYIGLDETSITNLGNVYNWVRKPIEPK